MSLLEEDRCRVTVVGGGRRVDVALPARAPLAEYMMTVAGFCGQEESEALPPAWSLAPPGRGPLDPAGTLAGAGIADGAVLYLCDLLDGEAVEPSVEDLREAVLEASERFGAGPWTRERRAGTALLLGAGWLAAASIALAVTVARPHVWLPAAFALLAGAACAAAARATRGRPVPPALRAFTAFAATPAVAVAAARLSGPHAGLPALALNTALGVLVGSLALPLALPGFAAWMPPSAAALGVVATAALGRVHADLAECAAALAVLCLGLTAFAPWTAGRLLASALARQYPDTPDREPVAELVRRGRGLLAAWDGALAALIAAALLVLAHSQDPYALGLAGSAALALWARSDGQGVVAEAVPGAAAAAIGLLGLAFELPSRLHAPWWAAPAAATGLGCLLLLHAVVALARTARPEPVRRTWPARIGPLLGAATVPLAVGVFGVYGHLFAVGHSM